MVDGNLYIISSPSGGGKTSIVKDAIKNISELQVSISFTTRAPRASETNGQDYYFCSRSEFLQLVDNGEFLEYAQVYDFMYGTPLKNVFSVLGQGIDLILEIDWQGAEVVKKKVDCRSIYIMPPSIPALKSRLLARNEDSKDTIDYRISKAIDDMKHYINYDYLLINDDFSKACSDFRDIITTNRLVTTRQANKNSDIIKDMLVFE